MTIPQASRSVQKFCTLSGCQIPIIRNMKSITASVRRWSCHQTVILPAPIATDRPPAPNWPQDPDFKKRQAAKDEKVVPQGDRVIEEGRPLRPDELIPKGSRASAASSSGGIEPKKSGLLNFDWFKKEEYGTFTGEPPRANLTDPPPGYQTPSPDQPYGIPPERKAYKPKTLGERMEPVR